MPKNSNNNHEQAFPTNTEGNASKPPSREDRATKPIEAERIGQPPIRKATGPRSTQEKKRSRFNALKHGLFSKFLLLEGESTTEYLSLVNGLRDDFQPEGKLDNIRIEILAASFWRMRRFFQAERAAITEGMACMVVDYPAEQHAESLERSGAASDGLLIPRNPHCSGTSTIRSSLERPYKRSS